MATLVLVSLPRPLDRLATAAGRAVQWLVRAHAAQVELAERRALLARPWEEDLLHWVHDGERWQLHGHRTPPPGRRGRSTTRSGWCPAQARRGARPAPRRREP